MFLLRGSRISEQLATHAGDWVFAHEALKVLQLFMAHYYFRFVFCYLSPHESIGCKVFVLWRRIRETPYLSSMKFSWILSC